MKLYSTNDESRSNLFDLKEAVAQGLAPDGGLFMPTEISELNGDFWRDIKNKSFQELAYEVASNFLSDEVPEDVLKEMVEDAVNFEAPVIQLEQEINLNVLELFHGPTLAFKDFGGRFMARLMRYVMRNTEEEVTILVATSGDTGSAVAHGFYKVPGFRVVLLYPKGKVSKIQEMQFTTLRENVTALEIDGTFDDCQRMVKQAFVDQDLREKLTLTSANSINIARLIPQSFYYFEAYKQALIKSNGKLDSVVFSIPSGNFGNLTAGLFAKIMGMPIRKMVASTNVNAIVPEYLKTGEFVPKESIHTISNAMDIGNPSNFARMMEIYGDVDQMRGMIAGYSFDDEETCTGVKEVFEKFGYVMCPHTAIGYLGMKAYLEETGEENGTEGFGGRVEGDGDKSRKVDSQNVAKVILSTAHPAKFYETVEECTGEKVDIPERLAECMKKEKKSIAMNGEFDDLKNFLMG